VSVTRRLSFLLALLLGLLPSAAAAIPVCKFATGGRDLTLSIALQGSPGLRLSVDWGDGTSSSTTRRLVQSRGRAYLSHTYAAPGQYAVTIDAADADGAGCRMQISPEVPYEGGDDPDSRALLPSAGAPTSSDTLADAELGDALAEVGPPAPRLAAGEADRIVVATPRGTQPSAPPGAAPLARLGEAVGRAIGALGAWLWGDR
jgi:hypothetical protein